MRFSALLLLAFVFLAVATLGLQGFVEMSLGDSLLAEVGTIYKGL